MFFYGQLIKPTETPYFSRGFDKKLNQTEAGIKIVDSCNISSRAIQLVRKDNDSIKSYWVDIDTTYYHDNEIRLKIVDSDGAILRYLDAWLVPDSDSKVDYSLSQLLTDDDGNMIFKSGGLSYRIFHAGDMMGLHHFDFEKPKRISKKASLQYNWDGYGYNYKWLTYEGNRDDFQLINEYSYEGELIDSLYVVIDNPNFSLSDNHSIKYNWNKSYILINGKSYKLNIEEQPFGGFGYDAAVGYLSPELHSFKVNGYIDNFFNQINFGTPLNSFDFLRDRKALQVVNETIKSIGYSQLISKSEFNSKKYGIRDNYLIRYNLGYSISDITDSLIFYYDTETAPVYYKEFWARRKSEKIADYTYIALTDIQKHYNNQESEFIPNKVNDTLKTVLLYDLKVQTQDLENIDNTILDYYNYLTKIGMTQSAYNLIFIDSISENISIDKDKIYADLAITKKPYMLDNKRYFLTQNKPKWIRYNK